MLLISNTPSNAKDILKYSVLLNSEYITRPFALIATNDNVPEGMYISRVIYVCDHIHKGEPDGIEFYHELLGKNGKKLVVRFVCFQEYLSDYKKRLVEGGYSGSVYALTGTIELVYVKHGRIYSYISERKLINEEQLKRIKDDGIEVIKNSKKEGAVKIGEKL